MWRDTQVMHHCWMACLQPLIKVLERLVHGPLTALMMLEAVVSNEPGSVVKAFTYRARNPLVLNKQHTIYGHYGSGTTIKLWCVSEDGVVGMTGEVDLQ